jgi:SIR2-like domain
MGYPSWKELTLAIRKDFFLNVAGFDNKRALDLIDKTDFPAVFRMCKDLNEARYHSFIADTFVPRSPTDVYRRFVGLLSEIRPLFIVTTNVEEQLESHLPQCSTIQRSDLSRCVDLLEAKAPFVAKLHGSVSSIASTVFTSDEYDALVHNESYQQLLRYILTRCTVVFVGYGIGDEYVIRLLNQDATTRSLFGSGPHFVVTNDKLSVDSLNPIRYDIKLHPDHKAALNVLAHIKQSAASSSTVETVPAKTPEIPPGGNPPLIVPAGKTGYYISDFVPQGTWTTSQEITGERGDIVIEAAVGSGFTDEEVPFRVSTALHDMVVGLTCFDYVYLPFPAIGLIHNTLGSELFWELVKLDALRFIRNDAQIGVVFKKGDVVGDIGNIVGGTNAGPEPAPLSETIRKIFAPVPGKEAVVEQLFSVLEQRTAFYRRNVELDLPSIVRGALLMPDISRLLGIGDAILPTQTPRWLRYPYLRLAHLVQTGALCTEYGMQAAKLPFGGVQLAAAAFGVQPGPLEADHLASYSLTGMYNSDLGALVQHEMSIMWNIIRFRNSAEGESFRQSTREALTSERGNVFNASVNGGLSRIVPLGVLQKARDRLLTLMTEETRITRVPAIWGSAILSDTSTRYWRAKSQKMFLQMCDEHGIGKNDPCICGSGDKMRLCCWPPLRE